MDATNFERFFEIRLVVATGEQASHPELQRTLEPRDLRLVLKDGVGLLVLSNAVVEFLGDAQKVRLRWRTERGEQTCVLVVEPDVALELFEASLPCRPTRGDEARRLLRHGEILARSARGHLSPCTRCAYGSRRRGLGRSGCELMMRGKARWCPAHREWSALASGRRRDPVAQVRDERSDGRDGESPLGVRVENSELANGVLSQQRRK